MELWIEVSMGKNLTDKMMKQDGLEIVLIPKEVVIRVGAGFSRQEPVSKMVSFRSRLAGSGHPGLPGCRKDPKNQGLQPLRYLPIPPCGMRHFAHF